MIRAFVALEVSPGIKDELAKLQEELKPADAHVKWVKPEAMHLTLKFLGKISDCHSRENNCHSRENNCHSRESGNLSQLTQIKSALDSIASRHSKFDISLGQIGGFPKLEFPSVLWVGVDNGCRNAEAIADDVEKELSKQGFEKEKRPFRAHLTLGRIRSPKKRKNIVLKIMALKFTPSAACAIDKITLFQSELTPQGSIYTPLHHSSLRAT